MKVKANCVKCLSEIEVEHSVKKRIFLCNNCKDNGADLSVYMFDLYTIYKPAKK